MTISYLKAFFGLFLATLPCLLLGQVTVINGTGGTIDHTITTNYFPLTASGLSNTTEVQGLCMDITHPDLSALSISLVAPDGTSVLLTENQVSGSIFDNTCFARFSNIDISTDTSPYSGFHQPLGNINDVNNGQSMNGVWQLAISFTSTISTTGTVDHWEIGFQEMGAPACDPTVPTFSNVDYVGDADPKHLLDVYVPNGITSSVPAVLYIHGDDWDSGSKGSAMTLCEDLFCVNEYVIVDINYRLSSDSLFPAQIYDVKTAIRFIKENAATYQIDTCKIGLLGTAAGGHLASLAATSMGQKSLEGLHLGSTSVTSDVHAVCDFYGATDFTEMDAYFNPSCATPVLHEMANSPESLLLGCTLGTNCNEILVQSANPITYVNGNEPPFYIHHGTLDCVIPQHQSDILNDTLLLFGADVQYDIYPNGAHGNFIDATVIDNMETFFINKLSTNSICNYSTECQTNLYIPVIPGSNTFSADINLSSDAVIQSNDQVIYHAGTEICLNSNFEVIQGADFLAEIQDCGTSTVNPMLELPAGETTLSIQQVIDGVTENRPVYVRAPTNIVVGQQYPLLFYFHGSGGNANAYFNNGSLNTIIDTEGVIGIYPQGFNNVWNLGPENSNADDLAFIDLVMTELMNYTNIDFTRVYGIGSSNGGAMINQLAKNRSYFNAIAPVVSQQNVNQGALTAPRVISVYQVNGDNDGLIPVNGGNSAVGQTFMSAQASAENYANQFNCDATPTNYVLDNWGGFPTDSYFYENCDNGNVVSYHIVQGGTHGLTNGADTGFTQRMWDFLKQF